MKRFDKYSQTQSKEKQKLENLIKKIFPYRCGRENYIYLHKVNKN